MWVFRNDSLRCWPGTPNGIRPAARKRAANSVAIDRGRHPGRPNRRRKSGVSLEESANLYRVCVRGNRLVGESEEVGSDEEGVQGMLEGGDRTVGIRKGSLEM